MTMESKNGYINVRIESREEEDFMKFCFEHDLSKSDCVRLAVKTYIKIYPYLKKVKVFLSMLNNTFDDLDCL